MLSRPGPFIDAGNVDTNLAKRGANVMLVFDSISRGAGAKI